MRPRRHLNALALGLLCLIAFDSFPSDTASESKVLKGRLVETQCDHIAQNSSLTLNIGAGAEPRKAYVLFSNRSKLPLWFPAEKEPAYRPDEKAETITIWFGYIEDVYGQYAARYMIPPMSLVSPGNHLEFELTSPALIERLVEKPASIRLIARIATKELRASRTRGDQPMDDYMQNSCVIQSS